jgi:hypothetical protein
VGQKLLEAVVAVGGCLNLTASESSACQVSWSQPSEYNKTIRVESHTLTVLRLPAHNTWKFLGGRGGRGNSHVHKTSQPFQTNDCAEIGSVRRSEKTQKKSTNQTMIACVENIQQWAIETNSCLISAAMCHQFDQVRGAPRSFPIHSDKTRTSHVLAGNT